MKIKKNTDKFYSEMHDSLMKLKPDEMDVLFQNVNKNNRRNLHACVLLLPGAVAAPTFYLEDLYSAYKNGTSADDLAESMINFAKKNIRKGSPGNIEIDNYENVKKCLGLCVLGIERNKEYLSDILYEKIEDLALVPMIFTNDEYGYGHIKVRKGFLKLWGVTEEEVFREAKENSPKYLPLTFKQLGDEIGAGEPGTGTEMFVVSNCFYAGGAAVVFYPKVLYCVATALDKDLFVLPSSINEMIVIPDTGQNPAGLLKIVKDVNRTQVAAEDVLTDAVYYYYRKTDKLCKILPTYA